MNANEGGMLRIMQIMFSLGKRIFPVLALIACFALMAGHVRAAPDFPRLSGRVVDLAGLLSPAQESDLTARLKALEDKTTDQLVVVTVKSLQGYEIRDFGYQLGRHWGIGQKDRNNGVLLLIAPKERKVAIEVGYGLEGVLTDALTKIIIENVILPKFRASDMAGGILAGANDIIAALTGKAEMVTAKGQPANEAPFWFMFVFVMFLMVAFFLVGHFFGGGGSGSGWSSGSSGGWSSGGGGFSGGGGSFGGGGSSGGW